MSLAEVIKAALDQVQVIAKTETIIGEPIVAGEVTLIPVSKISVGFAAGGAGNESKSNSGAGTGGGISIIPVAFITIIGEKVTILPVEKNDAAFGKILQMAPDLIQKVAKYLKKKDDKAPADSSTSKE
jgi:uncharacterized spore protein YtfJ